MNMGSLHAFALLLSTELDQLAPFQNKPEQHVSEIGCKGPT